MPTEPPEWSAQHRSYSHYWAGRIGGAKEDCPLRAIDAEAPPLPPVTEAFQDGDARGVPL